MNDRLVLTPPPLALDLTPRSQVKIAQSAAEMLAIEQLRYRIYIEEMHKPLPWADHASQRLPDAFDEGAAHFYTAHENEPTSSARVHVGNVPATVSHKLELEDWCAAYGAPWGYASMLMVSRDRRQGLLVIRLMHRIYTFARDRSCSVAFCHCNPGLVPLYEKIGFRCFGKPLHFEHVGAQIPMVLFLEDRAYFERIGSIFLPYVGLYENDPKNLAALREEFLVRRAFVPA